MLDFLKNKLGIKDKSKDNGSISLEEYNTMFVSKKIGKNIQVFQDLMGSNIDLTIRRFKLACQDVDAAIVFIDSITGNDIINTHIIKPLTFEFADLDVNASKRSTFDYVKDCLIRTIKVEEAETFDKIILDVLSGSVFLTIEGFDRGILADAKEFSGRSITEPTMEPSVKGPKEALVENLKDNLSLLRKRLKDPNLTIEPFKTGKRSKGDLVVVYIKGIANQNIVNEVKKRLQTLNTDDGVTYAQVQQLLSDYPNSIFPMVQVTERPDKIIAGILEGRVSIILDGSSNAMIVPVSLPILMQSIDDYYEKWIIASVIRMLRYLCFFISALLPSLYIAITSFHPGILPTNIALSIAGTRTGVPFPAFVEAFLMIITLEILQEAGIRLPRVVGQTVSIVGGLVIGQAAVEAGIISPIMLIVVSITAISSYALSDYSLALVTRIIRLPFMIAGTLFGLVGTSILLLVLLGYVASLESFGVGYLEPISPYNLRDWKDTLITGSQKWFTRRPAFLKPEDPKRQDISKGGGQDKK